MVTKEVNKVNIKTPFWNVYTLRVFANQTLDADSGSKWIILIYSPYTDVAVLCWHHFIHLQSQELWFHTGIRPLRKWVQMSAVFYRQCAF